VKVESDRDEMTKDEGPHGEGRSTLSSTSTYSSVTPLPGFELWERMKERRAPISFDLEVTARCNNNCRHCYINLPAGDSEAKAGELSPAEIERIAREAVSMGTMWCLVTGGEPLLREDFSELYLMLKRLGLLVSVFTDACLVTQEHVELFRKFPPRDIEVTVYGATEATYEKVTRRPGSFKAFEHGLDLLLSGGVKVRLKAMALRSNVHELDEIARFCRARTRDYYRFDPLLHLRFDGDPVRNAEIKAERLSPEEIVAVERADAERFGALQKGCNELILPEQEHAGCDHLFHCGAGIGSFSVSYDGKFRLCSSLWHPDTVYDLRKMGTVPDCGAVFRPNGVTGARAATNGRSVHRLEGRKSLRCGAWGETERRGLSPFSEAGSSPGPLHDAWHAHVPRVRDLRSSRKEFLERCRVCPIINLCLWCPAHAYLETGEMDTVVDYFCRVAHARGNALAYHEARPDSGEDRLSKEGGASSGTKGLGRPR